MKTVRLVGPRFEGDYVITSGLKMRREDWLRREVDRAMRRKPGQASSKPVDPRTALYRQAVAAVIENGEKPTDGLVAEKLNKTPRTIRQWRHDGLLG